MRATVADRLLALPTHTKILLANSLIIATGAVVGTSLVRVLEEQAEWLSLGIFVACGIVASVVINWVVVRLALRPIVTLSRAADLVTSGQPMPHFEPPPDADEDTRRLAAALNAMLARLTADAADLEASRRQLRALADRTLGAQEDERRRIARELHDETAQVLATLLIQASVLSEQLGSGQAPRATGELQTRLTAISNLAQAALESVRAIAHDLRPSVLDDLGLSAAIRWYVANRCASSGLPVSVEAEDVRLPPETETALYRVAQEALSNILKHARAHRASVHLRRDGAHVELRVVDDGRGFAVASVLRGGAREGRLGIIGMQERTSLVGGTLTVDSFPGRGTRVIARVPAIEAHAVPASDTITPVEALL